MPVKRGIEEGVPEDTEGNMPLRKVVEDDSSSESDDAEGNMPFKRVEQGEPETDDTEGNRIKLIKGPGIDAEEPETDDTEGNRIKFG